MMRATFKLPLFIAAGLLACCATANSSPAPAVAQLAAAEALIDAFYSFDPARLRAATAHAYPSQPKLLFYQGWAQGGNYRVIERRACRHVNPQEVSCAILVEDDLIAALGTGYNVTDTFHLSFSGPHITAVRNSSNDPPEFDQALTWLRDTRPELLDGPCKGFFDGGPTPQECVRAVVKGFGEFRVMHRR